MYDKIKPNNRNVNIIIINSLLIYGIEHPIGILRIINEEMKRDNVLSIKNHEIEFLLRLCHTNQISNAFKIIKDNNKDNKIVVVLFSNNTEYLNSAYQEIKMNGKEDDNLILPTDIKKINLIKLLFIKHIKHNNGILLFKNDQKFLNMLLERSALAIK